MINLPVGTFTFFTHAAHYQSGLSEVTRACLKFDQWSIQRGLYCCAARGWRP